MSFILTENITNSARDLSTLTAEAFTAHHDFAFTLQSTDGITEDLPLRLTEVTRLPGGGFGDSAERARRAPFSLVFTGPADAALSQGMYLIAHPKMGTMPIFLVPIAADERKRSYEAIFS